MGNGRDDEDKGEVDGGRLGELLPQHQGYEGEEAVLGRRESVLGEMVGLGLVALEIVQMDGRVGPTAPLLMLALVACLLDLRVDGHLVDLLLQLLLHFCSAKWTTISKCTMETSNFWFTEDLLTFLLESCPKDYFKRG